MTPLKNLRDAINLAILAGITVSALTIMKILTVEIINKLI